MTPQEALELATVLDADDTAAKVRRHEHELATRAHYAPDRIARSAAIELCASRGHPVAGRGCSSCVTEIRWLTDPPEGH